MGDYGGFSSATLLITHFCTFQIIISLSIILLRTNRRTAAKFSDLSTKNMIKHFRDMHRTGKDGSIEAALEQGQVLLETALEKTRPQIFFNRDIFLNLPLR